MAKEATSFPTRRGGRRGPLTTFIQRSRGESSEQKAMYHNVLGAGRSGVIREFFGLTDDEQETAKAALEQALTQRLTALNT